MTDYKGREPRECFWTTNNLDERIKDFEPKFDLEKALLQFKGGRSRDMIHQKAKKRRKFR